MRARFSEPGIARDDALAHVEQTFARTLLGLGHRLGELGDLGVDVLFGDDGQAVARKRLVVTLDLAGDDRHLAGHGALHLVGVFLLLETLPHHLTDGEDGHVLLGFEFGNRTLLLDHALHLLLDGRKDGAVVDRHGVDLPLVVEEFLRHEHLERLVARIAVGV